MLTGAAPDAVTALTGVRGPVVQTLPPLTGVSLADPLVALLDITTSLSDRNDGASLGVLQHQVEYAACEASVEREVVREPGEVVGLVASNIELPAHVEVGELAGREAGDVVEVVHLQPGLPAPPSDMDRVDDKSLVHWCRGEDSPGPGPQVPGQQDVALDEGDGQVVAALASCPALAEEQQQRHLLHQAGGEVELGLEEEADVPGSFVGEEGGVARHPAGEGGLVEGDLLLAPPASPPRSAQTDEALVVLRAQAGPPVQAGVGTAGQSLTQRP